MKLTIFFECICIQILSAQCDVFLNNLNASDVSTKVCIQKTINHLFSYDDTLSLILDNNEICEEAIFEMNATRPYINLNLHIAEGIQLQYEGQFIICPVDVPSLSGTIHRMGYEAARHHRRLGNLKILVITNTTDDASFIFEMFWSYGINNVIVLFYGQGISQLSMCNRYSPENACGGTAKSIISQYCEDQLSFSFTNVIHQMNKCPITFIYTKNAVFALEKITHPFASYILYVIQELSHRRNATFQRVLYDRSMKISNRTNVIMTWVTMIYYPQFTVTEPLVEMDIIWFVPKAEIISDMNAFVQVFSCNVWIAVGVTLICTWLTWFVIISWNGRFTFTFEKLGLAFISVWSLTICGCIAQFPKSFALRITLLSYLIYVIHIQCALTSNMATILTTPRYGFQIRNLEELAESGLPIYVGAAFVEDHFNLNDTNHKLYTRLQKQLHPVNGSELFHVLANFHHNRNYAVIAAVGDLLLVQKNFSQKIDVYQINDNSMTGIFTIRLGLSKDHYFVPTVSSLLSELVESGIGDKLKNDFEHEHFPKNVSMEENNEELTLPHLAFIFIFLGLGLFISCVVFCLEHVVHKFL